MSKILCIECGHRGATITRTTAQEVGVKRFAICRNCRSNFTLFEFQEKLLLHLFKAETIAEVKAEIQKIAKEKLEEKGVKYDGWTEE